MNILFIHSFIHSFILNIYIAPLQENYSEALPTPARCYIYIVIIVIVLTFILTIWCLIKLQYIFRIESSEAA